jgi:regulator of G-protein signaling 3
MQSREPRQIPAVNKDVPELDRLEFTVQRSAYGGFGFTVMDACPVKIGRVDGSSFAQRAGLQKGDCVIRVNGQNVSRSTSVSVAKLIK